MDILIGIFFFGLLFILPITVVVAALIRLLFGFYGSRRLTIWSLLLALPHLIALVSDAANAANSVEALTALLVILPLLSIVGAVVMVISGLRTRRRYFLIEVGCALVAALAMAMGSG